MQNLKFPHTANREVKRAVLAGVRAALQAIRPPAQSAPQTVREAVECQLNKSFRTELLSTLSAEEMDSARRVRVLSSSAEQQLVVWAGPGTLTIQTKALPQPN